MSWPPQVGELLPRAAEPVGIRYKLETYSLNPEHRWGGPKARAFRALGITRGATDYLETEILTGVRRFPVTGVRFNPPFGYNCVVEFPLQGLGLFSNRTATLRTVWELTVEGARPRLVTAFLRP